MRGRWRTRLLDALGKEKDVVIDTLEKKVCVVAVKRNPEETAG